MGKGDGEKTGHENPSRYHNVFEKRTSSAWRKSFIIVDTNTVGSSCAERENRVESAFVALNYGDRLRGP